MRLSDILRLSYKSLSERRLRATLTIIGILIGPFALVSIGGVTRGYGKFIVESITGLGQNIVVVAPASGNRLSHDTVEFIKNVDHVVDVSPFYTTQGEIVVGGDKKTVFIYAVNLDFLSKAITSLRLKEGDTPSRGETGKAVIGHDIAFKGDNRVYDVGDVVSITIYVVKEGKPSVKKLNVLVSGIYDKYGGAMFLNPDQSVFVNIETIERNLGIRDWSGILVLAESPDYVEEIVRDIREAYGRAVEVTSFLAIAQVVSSIVSAVNFISFSASLSAFAVAVAGVASTMFTSVMERTKEIGVMKALGFTDKQVLILIVSEGILMSLIGSAVGVSLGTVGSHWLSARGLVISGGTFQWTIQAKPDITPAFVSQAILLTCFVGLAGSIMPAYKAMKIPPAAALRYE